MRTSAIRRIVWRGPGRPVFASFPPPQPRARGTPGSGRTQVYAVRKHECSDPRASFASRQRGMPKPNCACRWLFAKLGQGTPQVRRFPGRPARGVYRLAPQRAPEVGRFTRRKTRPSDEDQTRLRASDRRPPGSSGSSAPTSQARGALRLGPPGPSSASPLQGKLPATAPRPASGDADQTPLGNGAGYLQAYSPIGIKSSGKARCDGGAAD
jgi:hypothetical protein